MNNRRQSIFSIVLLFSILLVGFVNSGSGQVVDSIEIPRDQSVWYMGYWQNGRGSMNPLLNRESVLSGVFFMYMTLFDTNSEIYTDYLELDNLIPLLGESVSWNADGSELNIRLRQQAKWSDGTSINASDVIYSFNAYINKQFSYLQPKISSITQGFTPQDVIITLNSEFKYSGDVFEDLLLGGTPIVPKAVFEGKEYTFDNNWFFNADFSTHEEWKIVSGPYKPYQSTTDGNTHSYIRNDNWWMNGIKDLKNNITWSIPEPKYIVSFHGSTDFVTDTALAQGQIDLYGGYVANVNELINSSTKLHTWVEGAGDSGSEYYPLTSAMNEIVFNYEAGYPLDQTWLHKALAAAINYDDVSQTAISGYQKQASATWLDTDQPSMAKYYNSTIANTWAINTGLSTAENYLKQGAYKDSTGDWYTLDAPAGVIWAANGTEITPSMDQDPTHSGINIKLGGWTINCVNGWTDQMQALKIIVDNWKDLLHISVIYGFQEYSLFIDNRDNRDFEMYYGSLGNQLDDTPLKFMQYFTSTNNVAKNVTGWVNQDFTDNLTLFKTATVEQDKILYMNNLQDILGEIMPSIPVTVNCYWYTYSDLHWKGWPNNRGDIAGRFTNSGQYASRSDYINPVTHWTTNHYGRNLVIINNLIKSQSENNSSETTTTTTTIDSSSTTTFTTSTNSNTITTIPFDSIAIILGIEVLLILKKNTKHK